MTDCDLDLNVTTLSGERLDRADPAGGAMSARYSDRHVLRLTCGLQPEID